MEVLKYYVRITFRENRKPLKMKNKNLRRYFYIGK